MQREEVDQPFHHRDLTLPSKFTATMPSNLEHIYYLLLEELLFHKFETPSKNLTLEQRNSLNSLMLDEQLVIMKADKGSNVVMKDCHIYLKQGIRQLSNTKFYKPLAVDTSHIQKEKLKHILDGMLQNKEITEKTHNYLIEGGDRTSIFYMLPKIHKSMKNPPGRPIVSSVGCPTEKVSQMLDIILRPFAQSGSSYIRDTLDFIEKIKNIELEKDRWIFSMDVTSLYTNIPHGEGIERVRDAIKERHQLWLNSSLLKLLECVPKGNVFHF